VPAAGPSHEVQEAVLFRFWKGIAALCFFVALVVATQNQIGIPKRIDQGTPFIPRPDVARLSSFGFHTAMADFYWLRAVQVVGAVDHPEHHGTLLGRFIDVVTRVDPWVGHPYRFAAVWLTKSEEDVRTANMLLKRSLPYHPDEWRNRFYLGFNLFYHLEEPEEAADYFEQAARLPGSPRYLMGLVARLRAGSAGLDVAEGLIREMYQASEDPFQRAEFEKMFEEIHTERLARVLDAGRERYRTRFGRDISRVEDLLQGDPPVMAKLPPEPHDWEWEIDEETGEIQSSWYGARYRPHFDPATKAKHTGWRAKGKVEPSGSEEGLREGADPEGPPQQEDGA
jgi:hypothetical protein